MPITVNQVRFWISDRTPDDNLLIGDLEFTDEEIVTAMSHAAREFNSIPPLAYRVDPANMPADTNVFFEAVAEVLYRIRLHSLMRNQFKYEAGGVNVDTVGPKIDGLKELLKMVSGWRETAKEIKLRADTPGYYARMG